MQYKTIPFHKALPSHFPQALGISSPFRCRRQDSSCDPSRKDDAQDVGLTLVDRASAGPLSQDISYCTFFDLLIKAMLQKSTAIRQNHPLHYPVAQPTQLFTLRFVRRGRITSKRDVMLIIIQIIETLKLVLESL